ncbi:MAG: hypothetical protein ABJN11_04750 [Lentilitoribacter sp.]|jgi:hypothetical protein
MIKVVVPAFVFATAIILSASAFAPRHNTIGATGCDLGYGVDTCTEQTALEAK